MFFLNLSPALGRTSLEVCEAIIYSTTHYCLYVLEGELETRLRSELPVDLTAQQLCVCMWAAGNEG